MHSRLIKIYEDGASEITIFIHGYKAVKSATELAALRLQILAAKPSGTVYLLFWKSGRWGELKSLLFPYSIFGSTGAGMAVSLTAHSVRSYIKYRDRADSIGLNHMAKKISRLPNASKYPVTLVGHSLGARLIMRFLSRYSGKSIKQAILMGAALPRTDVSWARASHVVRGNIHNLFSASDKVLRYLASPLEAMAPMAGNESVRGLYKNVTNHHLRGLGHTDYWPNLEACLDLVNPNRTKGYGSGECTCPYCETELTNMVPGEWECAACNLDFEVDQAGDIYFSEQIVGCAHCEEGEIIIANQGDAAHTWVCSACKRESVLVSG